ESSRQSDHALTLANSRRHHHSVMQPRATGGNISIARKKMRTSKRCGHRHSNRSIGGFIVAGRPPDFKHMFYLRDGVYPWRPHDAAAERVL
ncbi:hypothetical protein, partial [Halomonas sp.]|uniref:hypothetical protein n=1 Tax=Halomonas sp. TaxID=1486246 RepID=UPI0025BE5BB5